MPAIRASCMVCAPHALKVGSVALFMTPSFLSPGSISRSISMRLADISSPNAAKPVRLPPGRARL